MSREKNLLCNIVIYALGNFGSKFLSFLLLPFYTFYLSAGDYGYFDLITATLSLATPLITFQLTDGLYRFLLDAKDDSSCGTVIANSLRIVFRNLLIANLLYLAGTFLVRFRYPYLILLQLDLGVIAGMWMQIARGARRNLQYAAAGILMTAVALTGNILFLTVFGFRVNGLIAANILASVTVLIFLESVLKVRNYLRLGKPDPEFRKSVTAYSLPLIPNVLSWWFINLSDRFLINYFKGIEANGIYAVANKFPAIIILVNSIFSLAWQESAISEYEAADRDLFYTRTFQRFFRLAMTTVIMLLAVTKFFMAAMVNAKFNTAWQYVPFLYFGAILAAFSTFYGTGYQSSKETRGAFYTTVYGAIVNVGLNLLLIPTLGIQGASLSTMLAFLTVWLIRIKQTKKFFAIRLERRSVLFLSLTAALFTWLYYQNYTVLQPFLIGIAGGVFVWYNHSLITAPYRQLKGWVLQQWQKKSYFKKENTRQ
ncbi:MAG: polysaccharide biosynthesis C-terminal domain-containing protein [Firmicutes bacterium]|nr:polysaccharide biosynthesis C-terminal domain-containing protein [Bacillota bacterium]